MKIHNIQIPSRQDDALNTVKHYASRFSKIWKKQADGLSDQIC